MRFFWSLLFILVFPFLKSQILETNKAKLDGSGCLTYEADINQNRIPDFSNAGYKGGGIAIPEIALAQTISPISGDNTAHIQAAIDAVGAMSLNSEGFRGTVFLNPGVYEISGTINIDHSGVILKGSGDGRDTTTPTILRAIGNVPNKRNVIRLGGGDTGPWDQEVTGTRENITTNFVPVGSRTFEVANSNPYSVGDNIILFHPTTQEWLDAIDGGGSSNSANDPHWAVDQYNIMYNRFITNISGNEITIDTPVFNELNQSLSQSYIFTFDRSDLITNVAVENLKIEIIPSDVNDPLDEEHAWTAINFNEAEDGWVRNVTASGFGYAGVSTRKATRITVTNVHAIEPISLIEGGRRYNFASGNYSNNILFDNCYGNNGRHTYAVNGTPSASGIVFLRSVSENPLGPSEPHRQWSNGILYDNFLDFGTLPPSGSPVLAYWNRGDKGSSHGWSAVNSVFWNIDISRPGVDGELVVEQPPIGQNYAIGVKGVVRAEDETLGYVEHNNVTGKLTPESLYEAQLLCRTGTVLADFEASETSAALNESITFTDQSQGSITSYNWDFGSDATPQYASGIGPHQVSFSSLGEKSVTLTVNNAGFSHSEIKTNYISIETDNLNAIDDNEVLDINTSVATTITSNDVFPLPFTNNALLFDGVDDAVYHVDSELIDEYPFTMMAWFKIPENLDKKSTLLFLGSSSSNTSRNNIEIDGGTILLDERIRLSDGTRVTETVEFNGNLNDGNWHHVAAIYESPTLRKLFVDGVDVGTNTNEVNSVEANKLNNFSAGNRQDSGPDNYFQGEIDDVRLYNSTFTLSEIASIMEGYDCSNSEGLIHWDFNDQPSATTNDNFNFYSGTVNGASVVVNSQNIGGLSARIVSQPTNGTASLTGDFEITYTPNSEFIGTDELTYELLLGPCQNSQATVTYQVGGITWTGATDNDWNTASNWSTNTVPTTSNNIIIPNGISNYPTIPNGFNITANSITLNSGASLLVEGTSNLSGTLTYNRNISTDNWYLVSSSVINETLEDMISNNSFASGTGPNIGIGIYDNSRSGSKWDYQSINSIGSLPFGRGYAVKLASPGNFRLSGNIALEDGDYVLSVGNNHPFNLLGNPYPSYLAVNMSANSSNNLLSNNSSALSEQTLWIWNQTTSSYDIINHASPSYFLAPAQGFFVSDDGNGSTFTFNKSLQSHQITDSFQKQVNTRTEIQLFLTNGSEISDTNIYYIEGTSTDFDSGFDSSIFGNNSGSFGIYTQVVSNGEGRNLGIQSLPKENFENMVIPVGVKADSGTEISISAKSSNLPSEISIYLEDKNDGSFTLLDDSSNYTITLSEDLNGVGRFYLHTRSNEVVEEIELENILISTSIIGNMRIVGVQSGMAKLKMYNIYGAQVLSTTFEGTGINDVTLSSLGSGVYIVDLETESARLNTKVIVD